MRKMFVVLPLIFGLALMVGCAKPPQLDIQAAKAAIDAAQAAGAADYAAASLQAAQGAQSSLDAELQAQEKKFALFRNYNNAKKLAADTKAAGDKAVADANAGKEQAKAEATQLIEQAKATHKEAGDMLANAPAGKGSKADLDAMKADLAGVETSIADADRAFGEGRYLEAKAKAMAARGAAEGVKAQVQQAIEMRKSRQKKT